MRSATFAAARVSLRARENPDASALICGTDHTSYRALVAKSDRFAAQLSALGLRGKRVGLAVPRGEDLIALVLACLSSGVTYVPLDPHLPADRLSYMSEDAAVSLVILESPSRPTWLPESTPSTSLDELATSPGSNVEPPGPLDLAYVIYTSGSTGRPKGVRITQANLSHILDAWSDVAHTEANARFLFHSTLAFDASLTEFLWPLTKAYTVVVAPDETRSGFGGDLPRTIETGGVTHIQCTPTRAILLLADPMGRRALRHVRQVLLGGESLAPALVHELTAAGVGQVTNIYGPTECSIWSFSHDVEATVGAVVPIGRPLNGVTALIVDDELRELPADTEGELLIAGPFVGDGYEGRPDLSADKFQTIDVPTGDGDYTTGPLRMYRTGDRVIRRSDGIVEFLGRRDTQVKLRGQRIELGEIEGVLLEQPGITQAIAAVVGHGIGDDQLVAYVLSDGPFDPVTVRRSLAARLPSAMVPSHFVVVPEFPLTPSGKVDRRALPELDPRLIEDASVDQSTMLGTVTNDFATVFGRQIDVDDDFFDLGGHSLLAVELLRRVAESTGTELPISVLLDAPTPRLLSERASNPGGFAPTSPLVRYGESGAPRRLYVIHGGGGNVLGFRDLARCLRDDIEVIGVQAAGIEPGRAPDLTMNEMVSRYTAAIASDDNFDSDPAKTDAKTYLIGGYSDGGAIALHVAQALRERGASISGLVILDSFAAERLPATRTGRFGNVLRNAGDRGGRTRWRWFTTSWRAWKRRAGFMDANAAEAAKLGYVGIDDIVEQAVAMAASPGPVPAPALLIRSSEANPVYWFDYSLAMTTPQSVQTVWVPGDHSMVFTGANATRVADEIRRFVQRLPHQPQ
jgi:enterobactin synthetase component F